MKQRLDQALVKSGLVSSRSQAASYIKLGLVSLGGQVMTKPGSLMTDEQVAKLKLHSEQFVSRAALKLASVCSSLKINFKNKVVLDVGSSTGGFSDYALKNGAQKIIAVDVGSHQLHPSLRNNPKIELHEQTDIRHYKLSQNVDVVLIDVSFISLKQILPSLASQLAKDVSIVAMVKPQFEAGSDNFKHKGVIKNDRLRRQILKQFESWTLQYFIILGKADSAISGSKGNQERFYLLKKAA